MLRRTVTGVLNNPLNDVVIVLPDGLRQVVCLQNLDNFEDIKCRIELLYGLPYELQRLFISGNDHPIGDWVPVNTLQQDEEIFVKTEESWLVFVSACLRGSKDKVLQILDTIGEERALENRTFVALFIASINADKELITHIYKRITDFNILNKRTASGRTLLHAAVTSGDSSCIELILLHANSDLLLAVDSSGDSPITLADKQGYYSVIRKIREHLKIHEKMEDLDDTAKLKMKKALARRRGTQSLKLAVDMTAVSSTEIKQRSLSTPASPSVYRHTRLLERESLTNSLTELGKTNKSSASSREMLPRLADYSGKSESKQFLHPSVDGSKHSQRSLSPSPPRSLTIRRKSTQSASAPVSPNHLKCSPRGSPMPPSIPSPTDDKDSGVQQVVFLPPWQRVSGSKLDDGGSQSRRASNAIQRSVIDSNFHGTRRDSMAIKRPTGRSFSVAYKLTDDDLRRLENHPRLEKPWNEWRRMSIGPKTDSTESKNKEDTGSSKKSFEAWLLDKEKEREAYLNKMSDEERKKLLDKEKQEQERRKRCKSFEKWSLEKEIQEEIQKEEEREKETEKQKEERKIKERKLEAERKYEKWMMEKFQEELKREEKLEKLMQEKWKLKQQSKDGRKSIASFNGKKPLTARKSLPII